MLVKIAASFLIIAASYGIGTSKSAELKERLDYLECMHRSITILENEICFLQTVLVTAFEKISANAYGSIKCLFERAAYLSNEISGEAMSSIWCKAVEELSDSFHKDDIALLTEFSECLGEYDVEGQIKSIKYYVEKLSSAQEQAKSIYEKNKKLYKSLGLYSGILISALLI